ncbi:MAG: hypothetical protein QXG10_00355 [Candidatus Hadarchaeales archaeon]
MPSLRTLGVLVLTIMALVIGFFCYLVFRHASDESAARAAAIEVAHACEVAVQVGGHQVADVYIPGNFKMTFSDNMISVDGYSVPEGGLLMRFADGIPPVDPGRRTITVWTENGRLVVEWT